MVPAIDPDFFFVQNVYHSISSAPRHPLLVPPQFAHPVELPEHGWVMVQPEVEEFDRKFIWSYCLRVGHRPQGCGTEFSVGPTARERV